METAHTNTPKPADSARPLTIDTNLLGDLWLPAERKEREAADYLEKLAVKLAGKKNNEHLWLAWSLTKKEHHRTVREITERGGLLLIGGAA